MYIMIYILSVVLCLAVGIMLSYHLYQVSNGETSVEGQDHDIYRKRAKSRGEVSHDSLRVHLFAYPDYLGLRQLL